MSVPGRETGKTRTAGKSNEQITGVFPVSRPGTDIAAPTS